MRVLFVGPSLRGLPRSFPGIETRPPAAHGDLRSAVAGGATVIGLVDARFEDVATVWHKEILWALSEGVAVLGAASMGALRAAECHEFGMIPVGEVAWRYVSGDLEDDSAVAQLHAPEELGFRPLTEAFVDCEATIAALLEAEEIVAAEASMLLRSSSDLFFKDRTWGSIVSRTGLSKGRASEVLSRVVTRRTSVKLRDALTLVQAMGRLPRRRRAQGHSWTLARTGIWERLASRIPASSGLP